MRTAVVAAVLLGMDTVPTGSTFSAKLRDRVLWAVQNLGDRFVNRFDAVNPPGG